VTISTERRSFIQGAGLVAAAASTTVLAESPAFAQTNQPSGAKTMPYQAKPMSLDPKSIKGISEKVLVSHYENNYVGAVKRLTMARPPHVMSISIWKQSAGTTLRSCTISTAAKARVETGAT